jgi:hypothetical protein
MRLIRFARFTNLLLVGWMQLTHAQDIQRTHRATASMDTVPVREVARLPAGLARSFSRKFAKPFEGLVLKSSADEAEGLKQHSLRKSQRDPSEDAGEVVDALDLGLDDAFVEGKRRTKLLFQDSRQVIP